MLSVARPLDLIVIHCAAVPNGRWTTAVDIDGWHKAAGFRRTPGARAGWNPSLGHIGYHWVIYTNGARATGRHISEAGAHARGFNARSLGLCLIGTDAFAPVQWDALADQVRHLCMRHGIPLWLACAETGWRGVCGHRDTGARKVCPGFSVADWLDRGLVPLEGHIIDPANASCELPILGNREGA